MAASETSSDAQSRPQSLSVTPSREDLLRLLDELAIAVTRIEHPPAFTCEELRSFVPDLPGQDIKNLLVGDLRKRVFFLILVAHDKRVDLKRLGKELGYHLSFAPADVMLELLGVTPGAVTALGLFVDRERRLEVLLDQDVATADAFQFHPLVNDETVIVSREDFRRLLDHTGHRVTTRAIPARAAAPEG